MATDKVYARGDLIPPFYGTVSTSDIAIDDTGFTILSGSTLEALNTSIDDNLVKNRILAQSINWFHL